MFTTFLRTLLAARRQPEPLPVSLLMDPMVYARLDRLARHTGEPGDAIVSLALRSWLDEHEAALLGGSEELRTRE